MMPIKHYSFDLWSTLIRSNPDFKKQRAYHFFKQYNHTGKSLEDVEQIFRSVDILCNSVNEKTGKNIDSDEMYLMVIYGINQSFVEFGTLDLDLVQLYDDVEKILFDFMPFLYDEHTFRTVDQLCTIDGNTANILSNTAFIKGSSLRKVLDYLSLAPYFQFQIYSDEIRVSKPNILIFEHLLHNIEKIRPLEKLDKKEIMHIGDNYAADIVGANKVGIKSFLINSNDLTIQNLLN